MNTDAPKSGLPLSDLLAAFAAGSALAVMVDWNSMLASYSSPLQASWVAHGVGFVVALALCLLLPVLRGRSGKSGRQRADVPLWAYFGGIPGALTVVFAAVTVNSSLALSGTLSLVLLGQVMFGILLDRTGLIGTPKRRLAMSDIALIVCVLAGSGIIIYFR